MENEEDETRVALDVTREEEGEIENDPKENQINLFGEGEINDVFLTKEERDLFVPAQQDDIPIASKNYKKGYQNTIMEVHKQYNMRNRKVPSNPPKKV